MRNNTALLSVANTSGNTLPCAEAGGGRVVMGKGTFLSGTLVMKSHVPRGLFLSHFSQALFKIVEVTPAVPVVGSKASQVDI